MKFTAISSVLALAGASAAQRLQTPPGFTPVVTEPLTVIFGSKLVTPGMALSKAETASRPTIGISFTPNATNYLFFMIDLDVPANFANPSAGPRRTNLHAMVQDFKPNGQTQNGSHILTSTATGPSAYFGPGPPPENPPHAHSYVQLLFEQPANFSVPASQRAQVQAKIGFNLATFSAATGLGAPVAGNYFNVTG